MKEKTPHILNAASNLLGFCFFVLTTIKTLADHEATLIDEIVVTGIVLLAISVLLSFFSIRSTGTKSQLYETLADYIFILGVLSTVIIAVLLFFAVI